MSIALGVAFSTTFLSTQLLSAQMLWTIHAHIDSFAFGYLRLSPFPLPLPTIRIKNAFTHSNSPACLLAARATLLNTLSLLDIGASVS